MAKNETKTKIIYVYDDFSFDKPFLLGTLYVDFLRNKELYAFEYNDEWIIRTNASIILDPNLQIVKGRQYSPSDKIFGLFSDSAPDRWGRILMRKRESLTAKKEIRKPRNLNESDYLLGVYDETRMGGLRFKIEKDGSFISNDKTSSAPPWTSLRTLEEASRQFEKDEELNDKWLQQLLKPGSSLGGARPKATVIDENGQPWIAKFPSKNDTIDVGAWEKVAHELAKMCGLNVPESKLEVFSPLGSTFIVKRFDRDKQKRIHFASAMTLLGKSDGDSAAEGISYLDIASFIVSYGAQPKKDLIELWKRIVFYMGISNTDDHLRNHAFILSQNGWVLSPIYDINPVASGEELSLNVDEYDNSISIELAIETAHRFGIKDDEATRMATEILSTIRDNWERLATKYKLSRGKIEDMRPAFSVCYQ